MNVLFSSITAVAISLSLQAAAPGPGTSRPGPGTLPSARTEHRNAGSLEPAGKYLERLSNGAEQPPSSRSPNLAEYKPPRWPEVPDLGQMVARMAAGTVIVLALCIGSLWAARRWLQVAPRNAEQQGQMTLLDTLRIGNRCAVHLIQVQGTRVLVGVDTNGLKSMVALPERFEGVLDEEPAELPEGQDRRDVPSGSEQETRSTSSS